MGHAVAGADAEKKPDAPKSVDERPDAQDAAVSAPQAVESKPEPAGAEGAESPSIGERQIQAKSAGPVVGAADDPAEAAADKAADKVMRMAEPGGDKKPEGSPAGPTGGASSSEGPMPAPAPKTEVQRKPEPAEESRMPAATPATPAAGADATSNVKPDAKTPAGPTPGASPGAGPTPGAPGGGGGTVPEVATPGGAAPVPGPAAEQDAAGRDVAGGGGAETGLPAPESEPPAPEGQQPAREAPQVPKEVQEYLDASRGRGAVLPESTRKSFEAKFQRPFDDVRIHDDAAADDAARKIDALAFTRGSDIYFRAGSYDPQGPEGKKLVAHELAHVVQQRPGVNRKPAGSGSDVIRRNETTTPSGTGAVSNPIERDETPLGRVDTNQETLHLEKVRVPDFKVGDHSGKSLFWNKGKDKRTDVSVVRKGGHDKAWADAAKESLKGPVAKQADTQKGGHQKGPPYFLKYGRLKKDRIYLMGTAVEIGAVLSRMPWDTGGVPESFQIDHKHELQLGGPETASSNLWLLDKKTNVVSGGMINRGIEADITAFLKGTKLTKVPSVAEVAAWAAKKEKSVTFGSPEGVSVGTSLKSWDLTQLTTAHMDPLEAMDTKDREFITGKEDQLVLFTRMGGGKNPFRPKVSEGKIAKFGGPGYLMPEGTWKPDKKTGSVTAQFMLNKAKKGDTKAYIPVTVSLPISPMPGVIFGGYLDTTEVKQARNSFISPYLSPISFDEMDFDPEEGLLARGRITTPSIKLLENVDVGIWAKGGDFGIDATVTGDALKLPGPFKIGGGALTVRASPNEGLSVEGQIDFEIQRFATGYVKAAAGSKGGFELEGLLNFDKKMFDGEAQIKGSYKDNAWAIEGTLGVGAGKIKGIKKAGINVKVSDAEIGATGEFETSIPGVDKGSLKLVYTPATGMEVAGDITFGKGIPGIKSGTLAAKVKETSDGYSLSGAVNVEPSVPGLTGGISGTYEDGAFLVEAALGYERGMAKGTINIGVTNQAVTDGKPSGPPNPDAPLIAYGGGTVTLTFTPWLQGTVGMQLKPDGQIEVKGEVALPSSFEVFPEKKVEKNIFSIGVDIPLVGVAVAGQRIGIFATIRGGVDIAAGFGPGQLKDVALGVKYNPDQPEATTVTGHGTFFVPASAGLRVHVDGGLGAGIPVVSATAGVSIFGELGLAGQASASAQVNWSPATGVVFDAEGSVSVQPKFRFGIEAFVDVSADLVLTTVELYHQKWSLASFEYGSGLTFGMVFPIHYESGKPFDLSFDQVKWTYPQIEPSELLGGLMKQLIG